ncbi:MAG TPA: peptide chain release factor N(5)-glutamine methyltransferase, partial [Pyrinomonadaceae bacterium]|nr:peptide chain release factor N(5)-glutamine methyltransferase [Pyrinomonadaceae bacterium]
MSDEPKRLTSIADALRAANDKLKASGISQASREAKSLLAFVLDKNQTFLIAHPEYALSAAEEKRFLDSIVRRAHHEPFQYIIGRQEFYGLDFAVTKDVLIPRPETELIVEAAIEILQANGNSKFCEVGIGSGCIAVSILYHAKTASAVGLDISENALQVAKKNAETHLVAERLELKISNVFDNIEREKFDLIVSNPPYIPLADIKTLQAEVRDFEPITALTDGRNGLSIVEKIIGDAPKFLKGNGSLLMEIGFDQSKRVGEMFDR